MIVIRRILWLKILLIISIILTTSLFYKVSSNLNNYIVRGMNNVISFGVKIATFINRVPRIDYCLKRIYYNVLYPVEYTIIVLYYLNDKFICSLNPGFKSKSINIHNFSLGEIPW